MNGEAVHYTVDGPHTPLIHREEPLNTESYESDPTTPEDELNADAHHLTLSVEEDDSDSEFKARRGGRVKFSRTIHFAEQCDVEAATAGTLVDSTDLADVQRRLIYKRLVSSPHDELRQFRSGLRWLGLDQSTPLKVAFSWSLFILLTFIVPLVNFMLVSCPDCDVGHTHPFERFVQVEETALAAVSFLCLSHIVRTYGLRRTLLLDKVVRESADVRHGYESELHSAFKLLGWILLPCFSIELIFRAWWYTYASIYIPFATSWAWSGRDPRLNAVLCTIGMLSWLYRTSVFLFTCILFRLMCSLQILRLRGYSQLLEETPDVSIILSEHMRIRAQLLTISHRFRIFMVSSLFTIAFSQMSSLFYLLGSNQINFFRAGDLAVASVVQLTGLVLCLHGAAKITHGAQRIVGIVSQWHALATCNPSAVTKQQIAAGANLDPSTERSPAPVLYGPAHPLLYNDSSDDLESSMFRFPTDVQQSIHDLEAFQKRQALVTYLQHSHAGISLYGFVLDRGFLYAMFGVTFSLTLFILGKTIIT